MEEEMYAKQVEESIGSLLSDLEKRFSADDMKRVRAAYELAADAHKTQRRKGGAPYIIHPIAVARIVAMDLQLGANPVIAAFLHDVVEDTPYTIDDIRERFGDDVAFLVGVVTKPKKEKYDHSKQVDNFRQILASVQFDIRAILIKLSDRLHNMRSLDSMPPDKQMKTAGETDYFYAPLANRLGLYHVKSELENLSFRYRCPREYADIERQLQEESLAEKDNLEAFTYKINELLTAAGIQGRTEVRYRTPYSVWRKMQTGGCDFRHAGGKSYVRIVYATERQSDEKMTSLRIYSVLSDYFKERPGSVSNYINAPKENGYQSLHVSLLDKQGAWREIHISSERMARNSRLGCAAERTDENLIAWLEKFKEVLKDVAYHSQEMDYMDGVTSSFYNDDILVFTPKGKGVILPKGATAIDFAYEIHSEVGYHAFYARINGKLASVKTELRRGDCVEIGTNPASSPDADWIDHVMTYKAKRNLRGFLAARRSIAFKRCCGCHPLPGDEVIGFRSEGGVTTLHKRDCPVAIRLSSQSGDSIVAVNFEEDDAFLYPVRVCLRGVDRYHLLRDVVACVTERQSLSISKLVTETVDRIVETTIDFSVHSADELQAAIDSIRGIRGIDEVHRVDVE